jgi:hypothetical protein
MADNISTTSNEGSVGKTIPYAAAVAEPSFTHFLQDRLVSVKPVIRENKWEGLLERKRRDAYMYNSSKRTYCLPLSSRTGQLVPVLDESTPVLTPQYDFPITEKQFFEKILHKDLNFYADKSLNFWQTDKLAKIIISKAGLELNLKDPIDALRYRILKANTNLIASDKNSANNLPTYEFYFEDSKEQESMEANFANTKLEAFSLFAKIQDDQHKLANVLKVAGKGVNRNATVGWLKGEVYKFLDLDPAKFTLTLKDPLFDDKAFILDAVRCGALIRKGRDEYALDTGTIIGNIHASVAWINKPENSAMYNILQERVKRAQK